MKNKLLYLTAALALLALPALAQVSPTEISTGGVAPSTLQTVFNLSFYTLITIGMFIAMLWPTSHDGGTMRGRLVNLVLNVLSAGSGAVKFVGGAPTPAENQMVTDLAAALAAAPIAPGTTAAATVSTAAAPATATAPAQPATTATIAVAAAPAAPGTVG